MFLIALSWSALGWLGRQGTRAIAAIVFLAIALPPIDALLKPFVTEAIFALLCIAFLRVDLAVLRAYVSRPALVLTATVWTSLVLPSLFGASCLLAGLKTQSPDLFLGLMLQGIASPMMAAPAFAAVMGLDATLVLTTLVTSTAVTPFTGTVICLRIHRPRADALASRPRVEAVYDAYRLSPGRCGDALSRRVRHHSTLFGSDQRAQYSPRFRIRRRRYAECGNPVRARTFHDDRNCGAGFCGVFLRARLDGYRFRESRPRPGLRAWAYGFAAEYGINAGSNCRGLTGRDLALLRSCPIPYLSLTVFSAATSAAIEP